jgi:hypothetical protein
MSKIRRRKGAAEQQPGDNKATTGTTTTATARTKKAARRERERERERRKKDGRLATGYHDRRGAMRGRRVGTG